MNSLERVTSILTGAPVDRCAFVPVLSLYGAKLTGCPLRRYYSDPAAYAEGQAAVHETFGPDVLLGPFSFASIGAAFGGELHWVPDQPPNVRRPAVRTVRGLEALPVPDPGGSPSLLFFRDAVKRMAAEHGATVPIAAMVPAPTDLPALILGMETWMETVLFDPVSARAIMDRIAPFIVRMANGFFEAGAAFVVMPCAFASRTVVTRELAATCTRPALERVLADVEGPVVLHHGGAPLLDYLDLLTGLPAIAAFGLDAGDDLRKAREATGAGTVLFGGPGAPGLPGMTPAQAESECRARLERSADDPRFILYTSGPDIPWHTPPENIHAIRRSVQSASGGGI